MKSLSPVAVVGAGLAGCEVAYQLASAGIPVTLFEMRPQKMTPAHQTGNLAELVCSNSFKSLELTSAHGLLKKELELADSVIIETAKQTAVPAGSALAVDREAFSQAVEAKLSRLSSFELIKEEVTSIHELLRDFSEVILATGPLTSDALAHEIQALTGAQSLFFYDAIAPVIFKESIDFEIAFKASRYDKGDDDYINCPFSKEEYESLINDLLSGDKVPLKDFEKKQYFEGCLPIEVMAERGRETLAYGPMKPVGLIDPRTGKQSWAVLQLRQENQSGTLYNMVGCQTKLTWPEQERIFRKIPGLAKAEFARMGSIHRNTYINAPLNLNASLELNCTKNLYLAGQITGVEGYAESTAMGLWVALNLLAKRRGEALPLPDPSTMIGGLVHYLLTANPANFQPMNSNFGLLSPLPGRPKLRKAEKKQKMAEIALLHWKKQWGK